jgi:ferredoxin
MIVASRKPISEIKQVLAGHDKVLFVGCGTCVTVCLAGGEREVGIASYALRMARRLDGRPIEIEQVTIERQCENEFIQELAPAAERNAAILSFGCGAGVQAIAERFPEKPVYAALDTQFLGILEEQAVWAEKCLGCGSCVLSDFGGICPITRCACPLNGSCAGSTEERCEVAPTGPAPGSSSTAAEGHRPAGQPGANRPAQGLAERLARRRATRRARGAPDLASGRVQFLIPRAVVVLGRR